MSGLVKGVKTLVLGPKKPEPIPPEIINANRLQRDRARREQQDLAETSAAAARARTGGAVGRNLLISAGSRLGTNLGGGTATGVRS